MKFLLDNARKSKKTSSFSISFFFNARGDALEKSVSGMYRSLLFQLLQRFADLQDVLDDVILPNPNECPSLDALKDIFQTAISRLGSRSLTCFVDALDEGDEQQIVEMVQFFEEIAEQSAENSIQFKICLSSRHYPYIDVKYGLKLSLEDQDGHKDDLCNYVQANLRMKDTQMLEDLQEQLIEKSQGVFLWLKLVVDILIQENKRGRLAMKKRLAEIPPGLSDLFRDILARDKKNMNDLLLSISWILFAKRPLKPLEYHHALWASLARSDNADEDMPDATADDAEDCAEMCVLSSSKGLAEVTQGKKAPKAAKSSERIVQFIHESVRDYLLKDGGMNELWPDLALNMEAQSHEQLKECCLFYLKHQATTRRIRTPDHELKNIDFNEASSLSQSLPFLEYASQHVLFHADAAASVFRQDKTLETFSTADWSKLFNMHEKYKVRRYHKRNTLVYILADQGLANLISTCTPKEGRHRVEKSAQYRFPLFAAIARENDSAVAALLSMTSPITGILDHAKNLRGGFKYYASPLFWAAQKGLPDVLQAIIKQGEDVNEKNTDSRTPLDIALSGGNLECAQILIENGACHASTGALSEGATGAARLGDEPLVRFLIGMGAQTDIALFAAFSRGKKRIVEMIIATCPIPDVRADVGEDDIKGCSDNYTAMARYLIQDEQDPGARSKRGETLLFLAARLGLELESGLHTRSGADVNCRNSRNDTPLMVALRYKRWPTAQFLLDNGAHANVQPNNLRVTPLHLALEHGASESLVRLLLAHGADANARDMAQRTPLHVALEHGANESLIRLLIDNGAHANVQSNNLQTPLHLALEHGANESLIRLLIDNGAHANVQSNNLQPPLHLALEHGANESLIRLLLAHGADANARGMAKQRTPLHYVSSSGSDRLVVLLLEHGSEVDAKDASGDTPLLNASRSWRNESVTSLLQHGADANAINNRGYTPLSYACARGDFSMVSELVRHGCSASIDTLTRGEAPLHRASGQGDVEIVRLLLLAGANINIRDTRMRVPLHYAAVTSKGAVVKVLLDSGQCELDARSVSGGTPLYIACGNRRRGEKVVKLLIEKGANPNISTENGMTPHDQARLSGSDYIVNLLINHGTDATGS